MNTVTRWAVVLGLLVMSLSGLSFAAGDMDKASLEQLIKGNTVEGTRIKWKTTYKMFFDASGKYSRIDSRNNEEHGKWKVQKDGSLLMIDNKREKENVRIVKKREDGGYDMYNQNGVVILTMDKVSPGNPYNLQH